MVGRLLRATGLALVAAAGLIAPGQALARGGYDYNHPDTLWRTLETEHFYFHYPESGKPKDDPHYYTTVFTVGELARIAEEAYPKICGALDYYLEEKVHVVIYDQDSGWEGNGFAIAEYDWTGFAARWGSTFRQRGRMEFLSDVFVHEFAHIVSLKAYLPWSEGSTFLTIGGLAEDEEWLERWGVPARPHTNVDLGASFLLSAHAPFWWAEGGAEHWSHKAGYNYWGTSRDAFLRMSVLEDRVLDPVEWTTRIDKEGFDGERGYNHGYAFSLYLWDRFGEDVVTEMAHISAERWHWSWDAVVEAATGVSTEQLHADWKAWLEARYSVHKSDVDGAFGGARVGREVWLTKRGWEDPDEDWAALDQHEREEEMDGDTAYIEMPSWSPDGKYYAWFDQGLNIREIRPDQYGAISGSYYDEEADEKLLEQLDKRTWALGDVEYYRVAWAPDSKRFVFTSYEDVRAEWQNNSGLIWNGDGYNWHGLFVGTLETGGKKLKVKYEPLPGGLRGTEAAWSPDGETIAFVRYGDGTHELWTVKPDGSELQQRSDFGDGTQMQGVSYTPDGTKILLSLFRNYQQDLWLYTLADNSWARLTDSAWDETDPVIGPEGKVWFTSDRTGILNVYSMDLDSKEVRQQTNVYGGAYGPFVAPGGHLFYSGITGHGFRILALPKGGLLEEVVEYKGICGRDIECANQAADLSFRPTHLDVSGESRKYKSLKSMMPLAGWPILRGTDRSVEAGAGFGLGDYNETHYAEGEVTIGKDSFISLAYWNNRWWPSLMLGYMRYTYKGTYGYGVDADDVAATTDDVTVVDVKFEQASDDVWLYATYMPSWYIWGGLGVDASRYSFRDAGDGPDFVPYSQHLGVGAFAEWTPAGPSYEDGDSWINPRGGRKFYVDYAYRYSGLVDPEMAGVVYDDGELMDQYWYQKLSVSYTEYLPIGWFGLSDRHTLQLDLEGGWIDQNVMGWDEFIAGGRHPYHWGSGTFGNNVQFSGYEGWSLTGETMLIANASYRFPVARDLNWKVGPTYTESLYLQLFGTVGNLWSYRVDGPSHTEGYYVVADDANDIRREVPFQDYSSKNSTLDRQNYWLSDAGVELRVRSFIWNDWDWDSFLRLAYGFQPTGGYGDVNADLVQSSVARDAASELSDEVEEPTLRVYLGLGTGW